jgi:transcription elongation GreA/GreB family factor
MRKRILVVEDQADNRQIIRDMLAGTNYEITEAEDGEQALAAVAKEPPQLILINLAENSEYRAAKTEQERNEARIGELEDKLARAEIINVAKLSGDTIKFGATVTLIEEETGEKKIWQIVGEPEADAHKGKISVVSPIARALIGKSKGETIEVEAPGGAKVQNPTGRVALGRLVQEKIRSGGKPDVEQRSDLVAEVSLIRPTHFCRKCSRD